MYTRYDEMYDEYLEFDKANPQVYELFKQYAFQLRKRGFKRYGARGIFNRIRWETDEPSNQTHESFKLSDHHTPFYARRLMDEFPREFADFFIIKEQKTKTQPAIKGPDVLW